MMADSRFSLVVVDSATALYRTGVAGCRLGGQRGRIWVHSAFPGQKQDAQGGACDVYLSTRSDRGLLMLDFQMRFCHFDLT